eukprot:CAMPEP_0119356582 /NCGR_PEP_ID=MMETSP1334-20130426/5153_1 /TAXON_ID=127549 /ORGANISM="Calcidiscus leptoporus, Strain RCC1130" /LENGTH=403 /DNA_ID=CAMNT_0007370655 /DNA_START=69 /DNA_END=1280 /DNA_ORIENTATION=+
MSAPAALPAVEGLAAELLPDKDKVYFNDYSTLVQQQGMLQDTVRTSLYQFAVLENRADFAGKRVVDVGAGTGILSFFAARAGASHVYAVEASGMARNAEKLVAANGLDSVITVLNQRVEEVQLDERVDILLSEPLGIALVNERMLESYLAARDALLKPGGAMFPDFACLYAAPFTDDALYNEQVAKTTFWTQQSFYGVDLNCLRDEAQAFYFSQPVVGPVSPGSLLAVPACKDFDFNTLSIPDLKVFEMPFQFTMGGLSMCHGFALWFDCRFPGSQRHIYLSTSPHDALTHWYQVRALLRSPIPVGSDHVLVGSLRFEANEARGYNIFVKATNCNTGVSSDNTVVTQCALHHFQYTAQTSTPIFAAQPMQTQPAASVAQVGGASPSDSASTPVCAEKWCGDQV